MQSYLSYRSILFSFLVGLLVTSSISSLHADPGDSDRIETLHDDLSQLQLIELTKLLYQLRLPSQTCNPSSCPTSSCTPFSCPSECMSTPPTPSTCPPPTPTCPPTPPTCPPPPTPPPPTPPPPTPPPPTPPPPTPPPPTPPPPTPPPPTPPPPTPPPPISPPFKCCFKFESPQVPSFTITEIELPLEGLPLNFDNSIILSNSSGLLHGEGCNGYKASYFVNNTWVSTFIGSDNDIHDIEIFFATGEYILMRPIQSYESNLIDILTGRLVKLLIECDNDISSCIEFYVNDSMESKSTILDLSMTECTHVPQSSI